MPRHMPMIDLFYKNSQSQNLAGHHLHQKIRKYSVPNITSTLDLRGVNQCRLSVNTIVSGAFSEKAQISAPVFEQAGQTNAIGGLDYAASKSSSIYGKSSTVQPASAQLLIIIKI